MLVKYRIIYAGFILSLILGLLLVWRYKHQPQVQEIDGVARDYHPYYHHGFNPNMSFTESWGRIPVEYTFFTNSIGCKDAKRKKVKLNSKKRSVLFLGDSFTEGVGVIYDSTFVGRLDKHYKHIKILNGGVSTYSPKLDYLKAKFFIEHLELKIDEIIVYTGPDDIYDELAYCDWTAVYTGTEPYDFRDGDLNDSILKVFGNNSEQEKFARLNPCRNEKLDTIKDAGNMREYLISYNFDEEAQKEWGQDGAYLAVHHMRLIRSLCIQNNIKLTIAIYAWPQLIERNIHQQNYYTELWRNFSAKYNVPLIDHTGDFNIESLDSMFLDGDVHWNNYGHQVIAEKVISGGFINNEH